MQGTRCCTRLVYTRGCKQVNDTWICEREVYVLVVREGRIESCKSSVALTHAHSQTQNGLHDIQLPWACVHAGDTGSLLATTTQYLSDTNFTTHPSILTYHLHNTQHTHTGSFSLYACLSASRTHLLANEKVRNMSQCALVLHSLVFP